MCIDVRGWDLSLAPLEDLNTDPEWSRSALFRVSLPSGIIEIRGTLLRRGRVTVNGIAQDSLQLRTSASQLRRINRRAHYRVSVFLKGEIAVFRPEEVPASLAECVATPQPDPRRLAELAEWLSERRRPCLVRDLSLGGARLSIASPPPSPGCRALLDLALAQDEPLRDVPGITVDSRFGVQPPPLDAETRLRFEHLPVKVESRLSRALNRIQLELLKKGIRT